MVDRIGGECRHRIDRPTADAVRGSRRAKMGEPAPVLDSAKEQRRAVAQQSRPGVEHRVNRIRPIRGLKYRVALVATKEGFVPVSGDHRSCLTAAIASLAFVMNVAMPWRRGK